MTLSPVFRSEQAVQMLQEHGIWERFVPTVARQLEAVQTIHDDLAQVIGEDWRATDDDADADDLAADGDNSLGFTQDYFFLVLFLSVFESMGISAERLPFYAELNFCIMGTITAADNLFDDQDKSLLPLRTSGGPRYGSILQLMCFERLIRRTGDRAVDAGLIERDQVDRILKGLLDQMARIGRLEGSEEGGVDEIPTPDSMVEQVHRVRGGMLFKLAFVAPEVIETGAVAEKLTTAREAIARLGTAFQIVDDLTDFEFDLGRRSHNLLSSQIHHCGQPDEKARFQALWAGETKPDPAGEVESRFAVSASAVLERARKEARAAFTALEELGFWFPAKLADEVVHAIVGLDGVARMTALSKK